MKMRVLILTCSLGLSMTVFGNEMSRLIDNRGHFNIGESNVQVNPLFKNQYLELKKGEKFFERGKYLLDVTKGKEGVSAISEVIQSPQRDGRIVDEVRVVNLEDKQVKDVSRCYGNTVEGKQNESSLNCVTVTSSICQEFVGPNRSFKNFNEAKAAAYRCDKLSFLMENIHNQVKSKDYAKLSKERTGAARAAYNEVKKPSSDTKQKNTEQLAEWGKSQKGSVMDKPLLSEVISACEIADGQWAKEFQNEERMYEGEGVTQ